MRITSVVLAAGRGRRMELGENKAFASVGGVPLLALTVETFLDHPRVSEIVVVVGREEESRVAELFPPSSKPVKIVPGGKERRDSALAGVEAASAEIVLIHDGARPFVSAALIDRIIDAVSESGACVPVLPVADTLRTIDRDGFLGSVTLDRSTLGRMQTPQGFRKDLIVRALSSCSAGVTDDAAAVLALGEPVRTVPGETINLKITHPEDLELASVIAAGLRHAP